MRPAVLRDVFYFVPMLAHSTLDYVQSLIDLFYPNVCPGCGKSLPPKNDMLCPHCLYKLPKTDHHQYLSNPFTQRLTGRFDFFSGAAFLLFTKGGMTQGLIHQIKYGGKRELALYLGKRYGDLLKESPLFRGVEIIAPVPLHPKKLKRRGYNQSEWFAKGLRESMNVEMIPNALRRIRPSISQTSQNRMERLKSVQGAFQVHPRYSLEDKHILLVDDVLTTGATLESCANPLLEQKGIKLSLATIGMADF